MIYHWCPSSNWDSAGAAYESPSLAEEGFIHFSYRDQVARVASAIDRGRGDLVLLCVDEGTLEVVVEDSYNIGEEFPHIYSAIPKPMVAAVVPFPCERDGSFRFPADAPI
jgi:uncharacterized protein (DUF952 family)